MSCATSQLRRNFFSHGNAFILVTAVCASASGQVVPSDNESDLPIEADFCTILFPISIETECGSGFLLSGIVFEDSVTIVDAPPTVPIVTSQVGYGPFGTNPWGGDWVWSEALFMSQMDSLTRQYGGVVVAPDSVGTFSYSIRFSFNGGASATYADISGAGSFPGLDLELTDLGMMIVLEGGTCGSVSCCDLAGDADNSGGINIGDVVTLIEYIFSGGAEPTCLQEGDSDGSGGINIGDVVTLIEYIFSGGAIPICGA